MKKYGIWMLALLAIQYILGVITNLFVKFPDTQNPSALWEFAWKQIPTALHIILGFTLLFLSIKIVIVATKKKVKNWLLPAWAGFISILLAFINGAAFIDEQKDIYSFLMALFFITTVASYVWGMYKSKKLEN